MKSYVPPGHGLSMYKKACRCDICREANRVYLLSLKPQGEAPRLLRHPSFTCPRCGKKIHTYLRKPREHGETYEERRGGRGRDHLTYYCKPKPNPFKGGEDAIPCLD